MGPIKINEDNLLRYVGTGSWILLGCLSLAGLAVSARFAGGVLAGGVLAILNFYWMQSVLRRVLNLSLESPRRFTFLRYLIRLTFLAVTIYALVVHARIDLMGLFAGLSVLVIDIIIVTVWMALAKGGS